MISLMSGLPCVVVKTLLALQACFAIIRPIRTPGVVLEQWTLSTLLGLSSTLVAYTFVADDAMLLLFRLKEGESLKVVAKIPKDCKFVSVNLWNR